MLKEKENELKHIGTHFFGSNFDHTGLRSKKPKKKPLEAFKNVGVKKSSFWKGPL